MAMVEAEPLAALSVGPLQAPTSCGYPTAIPEIAKPDVNVLGEVVQTPKAVTLTSRSPDTETTQEKVGDAPMPEAGADEKNGEVDAAKSDAAQRDVERRTPANDEAPARQDAKTCRGEASPAAGDMPCRGQHESQLSACFNLPDVTETLGAACCNPALLARLGMTDASLHRLIFCRSFAERRAQDFCENGMAWAAGCSSLEQLQVGLRVSEVCDSESRNHLYFEYGGGVNLLEETKQLVHAAAIFAQKHPGLRLHVDAHAGVGAPRGIATSTSRRRAQCVVQELVELGVRPESVSTTAWGRKVASVWSEPEGNAAARAELYFRLDGKEFPVRPEHYQEVPEEKRPAPDEAADSSDSDGHPNVRRHRMLAMLRALGYPVQVVYRNPENVPLLTRQENSSSDQETED